MPTTQVYDNWKAVTEADFVSLFIKTWFAYISTLRVMFPEAKNNRGDGKYLNAYKDFYAREGKKRLIIDDKLMGSIETVYREGRKAIVNQFPEYYLWDFYHLNENFNYTYRDIPPDKSDSLIVGLKLYRSRGTKWQFIITGFVRFFGKYYKTPYNGNINFKYNISSILEQSVDYVKQNPEISEQDYISWLLNKISNELTHEIVQSFVPHYEQASYGSRLFFKVQELEKRAISIIWSIFSLNMKDDSYKTIEEMKQDRDSYEIIQQRPLLYFEYHMDVALQPQRELTSFEETWYKKLYETRNQI